MKEYLLLTADLHLFDGGAAGAGGAAAGDGAGDGSAQGGTTAAVPGNTRRGKTGDTVLYGKQPNSNPAEAAEDAGSVAGSASKDESTTSNTLEAKRREYQRLINSEYKDFYTQDTQRLIDRRFKEAKQTEAQLKAAQPILDTLAARYNITDGDMAKLAHAIDEDSSYWQDAADEAGMTVDQYKRFREMERQNSELLRREQERIGQEKSREQFDKWLADAEALKAVYPDFDIRVEAGNQDFIELLEKGVPVEAAYKVIHMDDLINNAAKSAAAATEQKVVNNVRARGMRPAENGASSQSPFTVKDDPSKWTKKDRAAVADKVRRGESIFL